MAAFAFGLALGQAVVAFFTAFIAFMAALACGACPAGFFIALMAAIAAKRRTNTENNREPGLHSSSNEST
jgi:predicted MFS family arabinose efflux permease